MKVFGLEPPVASFVAAHVTACHAQLGDWSGMRSWQELRVLARCMPVASVVTAVAGQAADSYSQLRSQMS